MPLPLRSQHPRPSRPIRFLAGVWLVGTLSVQAVLATVSEVQRIRRSGSADVTVGAAGDLDERVRSRLGSMAPLYAELARHVARLPRVALYADGGGDPEGARARLLDLRVQLSELLFPARVAAAVGPVPEAVLAAPGPAVLIVNLTPDVPLPGQARFERVVARPGYTAWRSPGAP